MPAPRYNNELWYNFSEVEEMIDKAVADEREAIDGEIEETISRYQIDRIDKQLRDMRNGSVRGLREAQTVIRKRGKK